MDDRGSWVRGYQTATVSTTDIRLAPVNHLVEATEQDFRAFKAIWNGDDSYRGYVLTEDGRAYLATVATDWEQSDPSDDIEWDVEPESD